VDDLQARIAARLDEALDAQARGGFLTVADRGLGLFDENGSDGTCLLSVADVARIAAQEAQGSRADQAQPAEMAAERRTR
jgi:hypothetical protein